MKNFIKTKTEYGNVLLNANAIFSVRENSGKAEIKLSDGEILNSLEDYAVVRNKIRNAYSDEEWKN